MGRRQSGFHSGAYKLCTTVSRDSRVCGVGLGVDQVVADVVEQDRLVDFRKRPRRILRQPQRGEVQQVIGVGAEGAERELRNRARRKLVGPSMDWSWASSKLVGRDAGGAGTLADDARIIALSRQRLKSAAVAPAGEKAIGVVCAAVDDAERPDGASQTAAEGMGSALAGMISSCRRRCRSAAGLIAPVGQLKRRQVCAHGASGIAKAGLPQRGQIEQSFHQDDGGAAATESQANRPPLGRGQQPVWESGADTAAVEVHQGPGWPTGRSHGGRSVASLGVISPVSSSRSRP